MVSNVEMGQICRSSYDYAHLHRPELNLRHHLLER